MWAKSNGTKHVGRCRARGSISGADSIERSIARSRWTRRRARVQVKSVSRIEGCTAYHASMTLATIVRDVYSSDERNEMHDALRDLLPVSGVDWHPGGVYSFWDPESRDVLYVGLTKNLGTRFAQHNGLAGSSAKGNKRRNIDDWFEEHSELGFSIIIQSAAVVLLEGFGFDTPTEIVAIAEGQLLEAHHQSFGFRPPWNVIGGSRNGATWAGPLSAGYFLLLTGRADCLLVARRTVRQLG